MKKKKKKKKKRDAYGNRREYRTVCHVIATNTTRTRRVARKENSTVVRIRRKSLSLRVPYARTHSSHAAALFFSRGGRLLRARRRFFRKARSSRSLVFKKRSIQREIATFAREPGALRLKRARHPSSLLSLAFRGGGDANDPE